jgi:hypothetical protein
MKIGLAVSALIVLAGCPADDSSGDDAASDSGGATTSGPAQDQTGTPNDDSATSAAGTDSASSGAATGTSDGPATATGTATGGSESTGAGVTCGAPIPGLAGAVGILVGDFPPPPPPPDGGTTVGTSASGGDGGGGPADDTLRLRLGNYDLTCEDPYGSYECKAFDKWRLSIEIPADMQQPGVYDLADLDLSFSEIDAGVPPECGGGVGTTSAGDGGGGSGWEGQLVIESIGPAGIVGCIDGSMFIGFDANGSFDAAMCGA